MRALLNYWNLGAIVAIAGLVLIGGQLQQSNAQVVGRTTTTHTDRQTATNDAHRQATCKASELVGMKVRSVDGDDNIGSINDLVIGTDGRVKYAAVSFGGFLGMGDKLFAVPFEAINFVKTADDAYARIDVTEETLKARKGFDQEHWPAEADSTFTRHNLRRQAAMTDMVR